MKKMRKLISIVSWSMVMLLCFSTLRVEVFAEEDLPEESAEEEIFEEELDSGESIEEEIPNEESASDDEADFVDNGSEADEESSIDSDSEEVFVDEVNSPLDALVADEATNEEQQTINEESPEISEEISLLEDSGIDSDIIASGSCGDNLSWILDADGMLTISGDGPMNNYQGGDASCTVPWYEYRYSVKSISLPEGLTKLGDYAFEGCVKVTSITVPDGVSYIGRYAFLDCTSLTELTLPCSVDVNFAAGKNCSALKTLHLTPGTGVMQNNSIETLLGTPRKSLTNLILDEGVVDIEGYAFRNCDLLKFVTLPKSLTTIGYNAFTACSSLTDVYYSGTLEEWQQISVDSGNGYLLSATIHYAGDALDHTHDDNSFVGWISSTSLPTESGSYYLTQDVTLNKTWNVPSGVTNLCLNGHTITLSSDTTGSVINVPADHTLNLYDCQDGGVVTGGNRTDSSSYGNGIYVEGIFTMYGGSISSNAGGVNVRENGEFTLNDGIISNNNYSHGGGVLVYGTFTMNGGRIENNTASYGAVYVYSGSSPVSDGPGWNVYPGLFTMNDGLISNNSCRGIYQYTGTVIMNGGSITANNGGGIYVRGVSCQTTIQDGNITNNNSTGVYVSFTSDDSFRIGGAPVITGNIEGGKERNLYIRSNKVITVDHALSEGASIGITTESIPTEEVPVVFTNGLNNGSIISLFSDEGYDITLSDDGEAQLVVGHEYGTPTYTWADDNSSVTATMVCANNESHVVTETVMTTSNVIPAKCEIEGKITYTSEAFENEKFEIQTKVVPIPATGHAYEFTEWEWSEDNTSANAIFTCQNDVSHIESIPASITTKIIDPTCTVDGKTIYTANVTFEGNKYTYSKEVPIAAAHVPGACVEENRLEATCGETGSYDEVVYCEVCGAELSRISHSIPMTAHDYELTDCIWSEDHSSASMIFTCQNDASHMLTVEAEVTSKVTETETEKITTYTAKVNIEGKLYSSVERVTEPIQTELISLEKAVIEIPEQTYTGKALEPDAVVTLDGEILKQDVDYTIAFDNNVDAGMAKVTISGAGKYNGKAEGTFTIVSAKVTIPAAKALTYNRKEQTGVTTGTAYTITGNVGTNAGSYTATAVLKDKNNYIWSDNTITDKKISWSIKAKTITPAVMLSKTSYTWDGKVKKPTVTVKDGSVTLAATNYNVKYASGRKNVGKYAVKVTLKGNYSGSKTVYFKINPKGTTLATSTAASKAITVKWKKQSTKMSTARITGYQIQVATDSKFTKNKKTVTVSGYSKTSKKVTGLKGKKKYYIRIRTYKTISGTNYYSPWSKVKTVTTKA